MNAKRLGPMALILVVLAAGGWFAFETVRDDAAGPRVEVELPKNPVGSGSDEPNKARVHVDSSGPVVSVTVRTPRSRGRDPYV
jgi:hypothetical protein